MLVAENLAFQYGRWRGHPVFTGLRWELSPGDRTVLLGPNGAGKSTLLAILGGVLHPQAGRVSLGTPQHPTSRRELRRRVAWMPQRVVAVPGLTVREQASYAGWLKGMPQREAWTRSAECLAMVDLEPHSGKKASQLSGGQLRRLGLAEALVHRAEFLLLDEPTAGLDPAQRETFRTVLAKLPPEVGVVVSTHQVDDLSEVFAQVAVLTDGVFRYHGTPTEFLALAPVADPARAAEAAYARVIGADR